MAWRVAPLKVPSQFTGVTRTEAIFGLMSAGSASPSVSAGVGSQSARDSEILKVDFTNERPGSPGCSPAKHGKFWSGVLRGTTYGAHLDRSNREAPALHLRLLVLTLLALLAMWCTVRMSLSQDVLWMRQAG